MMRMLVFVVAALGVMVTQARAEQFWITYEGNDFPENEGWTRHFTDPPPQRWLEDGNFFIDSRADPHTTDNYTVYFDEGGVDPEPGETFIMGWRLKVHEATPWEDPGVYVISDDLYSLAFLFAEEYLLSLYEPEVYVEFEPGVFHEFELRSPDMRRYELHMDGHLVVEGVFFEGFFSPYVGFGDIVHGGASLAAWDYFRFGVVPEPAACLMTSICLPLLCRRRR
jgi:hypothetical protein